MHRQCRSSVALAGACLVLLLVIIPVVAGCGSTKTPTTPTPTIPSCQLNNTATVKFENRSNSNATYDVIWDGSKTLTLAPSQISEPRTVAAGVQHTLQFQITNSGGRAACSQSTP